MVSTVTSTFVPNLVPSSSLLPNSAEPRGEVGPAQPDVSTSGASVENAAEGASGNNVTVSATGQILVRTAGGTKKTDTNAVIEKSNLPDEIKKLVIKIREMQAELRQKAEEMSKINSDVKQNPKQRIGRGARAAATDRCAHLVDQQRSGHTQSDHDLDEDDQG